MGGARRCPRCRSQHRGHQRHRRPGHRRPGPLELVVLQRVQVGTAAPKRLPAPASGRPRTSHLSQPTRQRLFSDERFLSHWGRQEPSKREDPENGPVGPDSPPRTSPPDSTTRGPPRGRPYPIDPNTARRPTARSSLRCSLTPSPPKLTRAGILVGSHRDRSVQRGSRSQVAARESGTRRDANVRPSSAARQEVILR